VNLLRQAGCTPGGSFFLAALSLCGTLGGFFRVERLGQLLKDLIGNESFDLVGNEFSNNEG
jgi:hypothetical protein